MADAEQPEGPAPKRGPGRPPWAPTEAQRAQVESLSAFGIPQDKIGAFLGVDPVTLRRHCRMELDFGGMKADSQVAQTLYNIATNPERRDVVDAAKFWLARKAGWREPIQHQHAGPGGGPIPYANLTGLDDAELDQLSALITKAAAAADGTGRPD